MDTNFFTITTKTIGEVANIDIKNALFDSYNDSVDSLMEIENFFKELTSKVWSRNALRVFLRNWRSPGYGSASFCALAFRVLQLCDQDKTAEVRNTLCNTAMQLAEIAHQDVGIGGINHQELYEQFACTLSGDDEWKLDKYKITPIKDFLTESRSYRQNGPDLSRAITLSLPEELYNYGEFTFIAPLFVGWYKNILGVPAKNIHESLKFISEHLGTTESHHFAAVVAGLEDYCSALGTKPDATLLYDCNYKLLGNMASYFKKFMVFIAEAN